MQTLQFTPVMRDSRNGQVAPTQIGDTPRVGESYALRLVEDGELKAIHIKHKEELSAADLNGGDVVAHVRRCPVSHNSVWVFVRCAGNVALNGLPPLAAAVLEPGDLLAIGDRSWLIASVWQPEAVDAPAEVRDKPCPVCGGALGIAPVVQCGCGRWAHLENASAPHDSNALNCYLAVGTCGGCGRRASLEPQVFPEVFDRLAGACVEQDELSWV
jgi:hypothetical protein